MWGSVLVGNFGCCGLVRASVGDCCCCCCGAADRISVVATPPSLVALMRCGWLDSELWVDEDGASMDEMEAVEEAGADGAAVLLSAAV